jgi:hypothetical protein
MIATLACAPWVGLTLAGQPGRADLAFAPLEASYVSFEDIKPTLVNLGTTTVYFPRHSQTGAAFLQRWDPDRGVWANGDRLARCGFGTAGEKPMELRPGQRMTTYVDWRTSVENRADGSVFSLGDGSSQQLAGRYRLVVDFAAEAVDAEGGPLHWQNVVSSEFDIRSPKSRGRNDGKP